jgi:DNA-binding transcriptional LysR family regulator
MGTIPDRNNDQLDLYQLRAFDALFREHSLTRAAQALNTKQPTLSKTLARLRRYFDDPLFIRVSLRMEPTAKALELVGPIRTLLDELQLLRTERVPFDPKRSNRTFSFFTADAGMIVLLPPLVKCLLEEAPGVRLRAVQLDAQQLQSSLESGEVDLAVGNFPGLTQGIRRQSLFAGTYMSLSRTGRSRAARAPSIEEFVNARHVLVSAAGTGHAHQMVEHVIEALIPAANIIVRVPGFTAAAIVAKHADAITTLPEPIAAVLSRELDMQLMRTPLDLPRFEIAQYWHERFDREPGNQWLRSIFRSQFGGSRMLARGRSFRRGEGMRPQS